jgi:hypothetical protein
MPDQPTPPPLTADELTEIRERLAAVQSDPWKYEPKHEMFVGTTHALMTYHRVIDLGRGRSEYSKEEAGRHTLTELSRRDNERIDALGTYLEHCREDTDRLLAEVTRQAEEIVTLEKRLAVLPGDLI